MIPKNVMDELKKYMPFIAGAGAFLLYSVFLFVLCGFVGHGASFWVSYVFVFLTALSAPCGIAALRNTTIQLRDWLFGYPIVQHVTVFIILEAIATTLFIILDVAGVNVLPQITFVIEFLILIVYLIFLILCFTTKKQIDEVQEKTESSTEFLREMRTEIQILLTMAEDGEVKNAVKGLSEEFRYSDPVSSEALAEVEGRLASVISEIRRALSDGEDIVAINACRKACSVLKERNILCKAAKRKY